MRLLNFSLLGDRSRIGSLRTSRTATNLIVTSQPSSRRHHASAYCIDITITGWGDNFNRKAWLLLLYTFTDENQSHAASAKCIGSLRPRSRLQLQPLYPPAFLQPLYARMRIFGPSNGSSPFGSYSHRYSVGEMHPPDADQGTCTSDQGYRLWRSRGHVLTSWSGTGQERSG